MPRSTVRGSRARASSVRRRWRGCTSTIRRSRGNGSRTTSRGSSERTRTTPPKSAAATLSACRPATAVSASRQGGSSSSFPKGEPSSSLTATAAATADAALPPCPPDKGRPFSTRSVKPTSAFPARSRTRAAAIPALFRSASLGISGWPEDRIRISPSEPRSAITASPAPVTARPRTSKPGPRFATVPGAKARTLFIRRRARGRRSGSPPQ